jgi:MFS family permease
MSTPAPESGTGPSEPPRSTLRVLTDRTFGSFFAAQVLSTMGIWIHNIAAAILVYELTRSALMVGLVSVAQFAPQLLFTPISGAHADRGDRRRQMVLGRLVTAVGSGGLAVWIVTLGVVGPAGAITVIAAAFIVGTGYSIGNPAMHAIVPALVRPSELASAVALNSLPFTIARAAGPALGALLAASIGAAWAFAMAAVSHVTFAVVLALLTIRPVERAPSKDSRVRAGLRYVRRRPGLFALLLGVATIGIGADPVITLTPPIADALGAGAGLVGALASAFGIGAGVAFLVLGRAQRWLGLPRLGVTGLGLLGGSMLAVALSPTPGASLTALGVGGVGMTFALTSQTTMIQQLVSEEFRGRVMALWSVAFLGSRPLAAAMNGAIADTFSLEAALTLVAVLVAGGAWLTRPTRLSLD